MKFKYVVAIVPPETVEALERELKRIGVGGMSLTKVKGFGEYKNFYTSDWLSDHMKIEVFAEESRLEGILRAMLQAGCSDAPGAGIVAVMPVDTFLHLRTGTEVLPARSPSDDPAAHSLSKVPTT